MAIVGDSVDGLIFSLEPYRVFLEAEIMRNIVLLVL